MQDPTTSPAYAPGVGFMPARLTVDDLAMLRATAKRVTTSEIGGDGGRRLWAWFDMVAASEITRRATDAECERPALSMVQWSNEAIAGALLSISWMIGSKTHSADVTEFIAETLKVVATTAAIQLKRASDEAHNLLNAINSQRKAGNKDN